jgi:hypothetical protein
MPRHAARSEAELHRIVIVGGGAGGLELATRLGDKLGKRGRAHVTLIDRERTHLWKPLLHEVAAGSMDVSSHDVDYIAQAHWHHFTYRIGEMTGLDRERRLVHTAGVRDDEDREITPPHAYPYDTLVIAIGSQTNDFGTPGVRNYAIRLDSARPSFTAVSSTPSYARTRRPDPSSPSSSTSRSSAQAPPASSSRPSCTTRRGHWSHTAWIASVRTRTSGSISSRPRTASCPRCRSG